MMIAWLKRFSARKSKCLTRSTENLKYMIRRNESYIELWI